MGPLQILDLTLECSARSRLLAPAPGSRRLALAPGSRRLAPGSRAPAPGSSNVVASAGPIAVAPARARAPARACSPARRRPCRRPARRTSSRRRASRRQASRRRAPSRRAAGGRGPSSPSGSTCLREAVPPGGLAACARARLARTRPARARHRDVVELLVADEPEKPSAPIDCARGGTRAENLAHPAFAGVGTRSAAAPRGWGAARGRAARAGNARDFAAERVLLVPLLRARP